MLKKDRVSGEEKLRIVKGYLSGEISQYSLKTEYHIPCKTVKEWLLLYKIEGEEVFLKTRPPKVYDDELKRQVCEEYMSGGVPLRELCVKYKIAGHPVIRRWLKKYNKGIAFKPHRPAEEKAMPKGRTTSYEERAAAVDLCIKAGYDYHGAAEAANVSYNQIYSWVKKYRQSGYDGLKDGRGRKKPECVMDTAELLKASNRMLEARNRMLQMENDFLKKLKEAERGDYVAGD